MRIPMSQEQQARPNILPADAIAAFGRTPITTDHLKALSDLSRSDAKVLARIWPDLPESIRVDALTRFEQIAEDRVDFQFNRIFRIALDDASPVARQLAVSGLWEDESVDLIDWFVALMDTDESIDVRAQAASALASFANKAAMDELDEESCDLLRSALTTAAGSLEQSELVRRRALESVSVFGDQVGITELITEAYDSDDTATRASAIYAMGRCLDRRWLGTVLAELDSDDAEMRFEAARACGELGHIDAVPGLSSLVQDHDVEVRQATITALGKIGGPAAVRVLRAFAPNCPPSDRELVDDALEEARAFQSDARVRA
jgi:HEAT repeat protein